MLDTILCALQSFWYWIVDQTGTLMNGIIGTLLLLLPNTPFEFERVDWGVFGQAVGYFIPVSQMAADFVLLLAAILIYYAIRHFLRLLQMVK
jgi:hypothetical protein